MPDDLLPASSSFLPGTVALPLVGDAVRWGILRELALGGPLTVMQLTPRVSRTATLISKNLAVMREGRIVRQRPDLARDRRTIPWEIEPHWRVPADATLLDFGCALIRLTRTA